MGDCRVCDKGGRGDPPADFACTVRRPSGWEHVGWAELEKPNVGPRFMLGFLRQRDLCCDDVPTAAGQTSGSESIGLRTPPPPTFNTWVYIIVVATSEWPSSSCTVRMS